MNILILSAPNPYKGAGIVAKDLADALRSIDGNDVKLLVKTYGRHLDKDIFSVDSFVQYSYMRIFEKITRLLSDFNVIKKRTPDTDKNYYVFDPDQTTEPYSTERILKKVAFRPDAIIVMFMTKFLSYNSLCELHQETGAPIFLYFMDMAPMTGACHYAWECDGYTKSCQRCPAFLSSNYRYQAQLNLEQAKKSIDKTNIIPLAATEWQLRQLNRSNLYKRKNKYKIILGIDDKKFRPVNKSAIKKQLGLPNDKKILCFGAGTLAEKRKGIRELITALHILKDTASNATDIHLLMIGKSTANIEAQLPFSYSVLGTLSHENLPKAFQVADLYISPSIEDSGPMMVNQAIMCGTPVVAFEMGVALDLVHTGVTGYRANLGDSAALAVGAKSILELDPAEYKIMAGNCRKLALTEFRRSVYAQKFMKLIRAFV